MKFLRPRRGERLIVRPAEREKGKPLRPGNDRRQERVQIVGNENEVHILRRLFQDHYLKVEQEFNRIGQPHGKFISYHPNGNPFFTAEYQNGENFGVMRRFAPDGKLVKEFRFDNSITVTTRPRQKK